MKLEAIEYLTISEMAEILNIPYITAKQRLRRAEKKPVTNEALYDSEVLEAIRNVPGKGRPKKTTEAEEPTKKKENKEEL